MSSPNYSSNFPQLASRVNKSLPTFYQNLSKWELILQRFDAASIEASSESKTAAAITKHTAQQILGARINSCLKSIYQTFSNLYNQHGTELFSFVILELHF